MVMVMNILIVFLLMFVESLDDQNKYPNLLKPYNLHIQKMLCPKCEAWCANDPFFICGYSCQDIQHIEYDHKLGKRMLERDLSYVQFYAGNASFKPDLHFTSFENETILKEICDDKKTYNCTFTPFIYPLKDRLPIKLNQRI
uniref:Uncharacterized protein n=1 Tax=Meloidogyne incognita TaxID=6306 RepID=A0A914P0R2_MELIC